MLKKKWRGSFCHGFAPDQNSEVERELGQSPALSQIALESTKLAVTPAEAGAQLSPCFHKAKRDASLRWHNGRVGETSHNHQHWKRSDFKSGGDIG